MDVKKLTAADVRAWLLAVETDLARVAKRLEPLVA